MFILFVSLNKSPEFLMCDLLIVLKSGVNIFLKDFVMLWDELDLIQEWLVVKEFLACEV